MSGVNTVSVTESTNTVQLSEQSTKVTVTEQNPTVTVSAPFSKVGTDQLIFQTFTDGSTQATPENSTDTFTFTGTAPITATINSTSDTLTIGASVDTDLSSVSSSDDTVASAKAIKAYVDSQVTAQDLDFTTDTSGNSAVDLDSQVLTFAGGEGVNVTHSGQTITVASEDSSGTNKGAVIVAGTSPVNVAYSSGTATISASDATTSAKGVSSFSSSDFSVTSGAVSLVDITTSHIASSTLDTDLSSVSGNDDTIPSAKATKAYVDSAASQATTAAQGVGTGDSPTFVNQTLTGSLRGPATFTIDPATVGDNTGTLVVAGNLQVDGTTTTVNSTTLTVDDKNIELGTVGSPSDTTADGGGITLKGASDKTILWDNANDNWTSSEHVNVANGKEYKVNNASVLNATTLGSSVVNSSLTTVAGGQVSTLADATALAIALG